MNTNEANKGAGKGDKPRNCFSHKFKENYDSIKWSEENDKSLIKKQLKNKHNSSTYIYR
jgi:hypothetical protein